MNFSVVLFVLVISTGLLWCMDIFVWRPQRKLAAEQAVKQHIQNGSPLNPELESTLKANLLRQPLWLEYSASFFPVILFVFVLRSFVVEPFKIPSGSMVPTLLVGDLILVNKFAYGIRLPILDKKIVSVKNPQPGDVVVFRYPEDPNVDYIKRVVGVAGDVVDYHDKRLTINGNALPVKSMEKYYDSDNFNYFRQFNETINGKTHAILNEEGAPAYVTGQKNFPFRENCQYDIRGFRCVVPQGHYFMMGDNRDNSSDSRIWGFVSDQQIVGKAFLVWMNFNTPSRIGYTY